MKLDRTFWILIVLLVALPTAAFALFQFYQHAMFVAWQHAPVKTLEPHPAIQIYDSTSPFFVWKCDNSFSIEFDNGFVIDANTKMDKLPKEWHTEPSFPVNGGEFDVRDQDNHYQFTAIIGNDHTCIELTTGRCCKAAIKDLHSGKTMRLDRCTTEQLDYFFRSALQK